MIAFDWSLPYRANRQPVFARNMVASSQPLAVAAGIDAMARGGNAIDAAIATAITLTVVEPTMNGIGSDAFALVWAEGKLHGLNASGRAPAAWSPARFSGMDTMPRMGWDCVTVPGAVSAWVALSKRFGRLPFGDLFTHAIRHASEGYPVSPVTAAAWQGSVARYRDFAEWQRVFAPGGSAPCAGDIFRSADMARTLARIAETRGEAFYRGDIAKAIAAASHADGGAMTTDDLAAHQGDWVEPIDYTTGGVTVHEIPPNGQGIAGLMALGISEHLAMDDVSLDSADGMHLLIESMKCAFADTALHVADPGHMQVTAGAMLDRDYLRTRAQLISRTEARDFAHGLPGDRGTVLLTTADASGMMVSLIQSNFAGFGSGVVVPGTGISLQNRGSGFVLEPAHPNEVAGGKRPYHTIIPGFATQDGAPLMAFGVMGGSLQPQGHLQVIRRMLRGQNPQAASDAPRWRVGVGRQVLIEDAVPENIAQALRERGHAIERPASPEFGGAQIIVRLPDGGYCAGSDHRKDGHAAGF